MAQPRRRKAGISSNSALLSRPLPRGGARTCSRSTDTSWPPPAMASPAGGSGRFRRGRRDRGRCIRVHGRGEGGGAAYGHGGSIDALDDGMNACVHGLRRLHRNRLGVIARQLHPPSGAPACEAPLLTADGSATPIRVIAAAFRRIVYRCIRRHLLRFGGGCPLYTHPRRSSSTATGIEGAEAGRRPGDGRGAALGRDPGGHAVAVSEGVLHRLGDVRLLLLGLRLRPGLAQRFAGDGEDAVLAQPRPQQIGGPELIAVAADGGGEIDVEPGDGRFDLGRALGSNASWPFSVRATQDANRVRLSRSGSARSSAKASASGRPVQSSFCAARSISRCFSPTLMVPKASSLTRMAGRSGVSVALMSSASSW